MKSGCGTAIAISLLIIVVCGFMFNRGSDDSVSVPATSTPKPVQDFTLEEYWNQGACFDLFDRIWIQLESGMTLDAVVTGMVRASENYPGALSRYGVQESVEHCLDKYIDRYRRSR